MRGCRRLFQVRWTHWPLQFARSSYVVRKFRICCFKQKLLWKAYLASRILTVRGTRKCWVGGGSLDVVCMMVCSGCFYAVLRSPCSAHKRTKWNCIVSYVFLSYSLIFFRFWLLYCTEPYHWKYSVHARAVLYYSVVLSPNTHLVLVRDPACSNVPAVPKIHRSYHIY